MTDHIDYSLEDRLTLTPKSLPHRWKSSGRSKMQLTKSAAPWACLSCACAICQMLTFFWRMMMTAFDVLMMWAAWWLDQSIAAFRPMKTANDAYLKE